MYYVGFYAVEILFITQTVSGIITETDYITKKFLMILQNIFIRK